MVSISTPYNPAYYSSVVNNYKQQWKRKTDKELKLTDEQIYNVWRDSYADEYQIDGKEVPHDEYVLFILDEENEQLHI